MPLPTKEEAAKLRVAIVYTCWHAELINEMRDRCRARLLERGVLAANIVEVCLWLWRRRRREKWMFVNTLTSFLFLLASLPWLV